MIIIRLFQKKDVQKAAANSKSKDSKLLSYCMESFFADPNYSKETKVFYDQFKKDGYDAIPDVRDVLSGTSETATIILNTDKVKVKSSTYITKDILRNGKAFAKKSGKLPISDVVK